MISRGMTLDERIYADPFKFDPSRFLPAPEGRGEPYPAGSFGFGRRCINLIPLNETVLTLIFLFPGYVQVATLQMQVCGLQ